MTSVLCLAVAAVLKGFALFALIGGGILAGAVALAAGLGIVVLALALGLLAGTAGLALGLLVVGFLLLILLCPLLVPAALVYLLVRRGKRGQTPAPANPA
jgi:hypothetical protein